MTSMTHTIETANIGSELEAAMPLIKTDRLGRLMITPEHREALLDKFERSGVSGQQFAKHHGIKYTTFTGWCQKRRRSRVSLTSSSDSSDHEVISSLTEVVSTSETSTNGVRLSLGGRVELTLNTQAQVPLVAKLIQALQPHVS